MIRHSSGPPGTRGQRTHNPNKSCIPTSASPSPSSSLLCSAQYFRLPKPLSASACDFSSLLSFHGSTPPSAAKVKFLRYSRFSSGSCSWRSRAARNTRLRQTIRQPITSSGREARTTTKFLPPRRSRQMVVALPSAMTRRYSQSS